MIERALITALIALGLAGALAELDIGRLFEIDLAPAPHCSALQADTCAGRGSD